MSYIIPDKGPYKECFCTGPKNGQPKCPCEMRGLIQRDGRWIEPERDLGPVNNSFSNWTEAYSKK